MCKAKCKNLQERGSRFRLGPLQLPAMPASDTGIPEGLYNLLPGGLCVRVTRNRSGTATVWVQNLGQRCTQG